MFSGACSCKSGCATKKCKCVKSGTGCSDDCKCPLAICKNRKDNPDNSGNGSPIDDKSVLSDVSNNTTAGTMSLLNDTYQIPDDDLSKRKITPPLIKVESANTALSPKKLKKEDNSIFKIPFDENTVQTPPTLKMSDATTDKRKTLFKSPIRD